MKQNLRGHEILGLFYQFLGATCVGIGIYLATWFAVRSIYYSSLILTQGWEWVTFPIFFGIGGVLWTLGAIEVKEAQPGYGRRR